MRIHSIQLLLSGDSLVTIPLDFYPNLPKRWENNDFPGMSWVLEGFHCGGSEDCRGTHHEEELEEVLSHPLWGQGGGTFAADPFDYSRPEIVW
jgi:hypothetical protein